MIISSVFTQCNFILLLMDSTNTAVLYFSHGGPKVFFFSFHLRALFFFYVVNKLISSTYGLFIYRC